MQIKRGTLRDHQEYLSHYNKMDVGPVIWKQAEIQTATGKHLGTTRGSLALSLPDNNGESEVLPGLSMAVQEMEVGESTELHLHSWLHLYIVLSGKNAKVYLGSNDDQEVSNLEFGDVLLIPARCPHRFDNSGGSEKLLMMRMQDLPNLARVGNLVHEDC